jgi:uncharacterized protein (TIGR02246 family)
MATSTDTDTIRSVLGDLIAAWSCHDAGGYGALFTEDATYVTFVGTSYRGRADIVRGHRALFDRFLAGTRLADEIVELRFYGADTAVVTSHGDTYKGVRPKRLSKVQTYTLVRESDGVWRIAAFQNTKRRPLLERISFLLEPASRPA